MAMQAAVDNSTMLQRSKGPNGHFSHAGSTYRAMLTGGGRVRGGDAGFASAGGDGDGATLGTAETASLPSRDGSSLSPDFGGGGGAGAAERRHSKAYSRMASSM